MSLVEKEIFIAAAPEQVWSVVMDPHRFAEWVTIHKRLDSTSDGDPREGYRMVQHLHLRGATFKVSWELVQCDMPRHALWEGHGPAHARASTDYRLHSAEGGTNFVYRNEFHTPLGPLGSLASRALMGDAPAREAEHSLTRLKQLVETEAA